MKDKLDKVQILNRIKTHYGFKQKSQLAGFLGINTSTLSNWYARNTLDLDLILEKCVDLNPNWIINGKNTQHLKQSDTVDTNNQNGEELLKNEIQHLKQVISAQEQTISAQAKTIELMNKLINK